MLDRITISAPLGTREELIALAHKEGKNLSKFLATPASQMTYICEHPSGKVKVGVSNNPKSRAVKFGRIVAIIFDDSAEQAILKNFPRDTPPDDVKESKTEWVDASTEDICAFAAEKGYDVLAVSNGYGKGNGLQRGRPGLSPSDLRKYPVNVNVTPDEKRKIELAAEAAGLTISDYLRAKLLGALLKETNR